MNICHGLDGIHKAVSHSLGSIRDISLTRKEQLTMLDHLGSPSVLLLNEEETASIIMLNSHDMMNDVEWEAAKNCVLHQMDEMRACTMEHQAIERLDIQDSQEIAQPTLGPSDHSGMTSSSDLSSEN